MNKDELIQSFIEIKLNTPDDFLRIKETLTRIGVANKANDTLVQSCHILHKQSRYYIVHFKELFALDNKPISYSDEDLARRNSIARLLQTWNLCTILNDNANSPLLAGRDAIKIIPFCDKQNWKLVEKYTIG